MTTEKLNAAIQLIQSGNKENAVPVLRELIQANTLNESAWLWLSVCMDDLEQKKFCLQSVLTINPNNQQARDALTALTAPTFASTPVAAPELDTGPELASWLKPAKTVKLGDLSWDVAAPEETDWDKAAPKPEKSLWEKAEPDDVFWRQAAPEKMALGKMEWEEEAEESKTQPPPIAWNQWDEAEPVVAPALKPSKPSKLSKPKAVKAPSRPAARRKVVRGRWAFWSMLAGLVLFMMLCTVCFVVLAQIFTITP